MNTIKKFKIAAYCSFLVAIMVIFCNFSAEVYALGYVRQEITVKNDHSPLRIGGGDMFLTADHVNAGESFLVASHYVDALGKVWFEIRHDGRMLYIAKNDCTIKNELTVIPERHFDGVKKPTVYLSPSRQPHNAYAVGDTNEMEQMEQLCDILAELLRDEYGFNVITAPSYMRIIKSGRPYDAYLKKADVYLAVHSNATSTGIKCRGAEAYYYSACSQSKLLAENIVSELNAVSDYAPSNSSGAVSAMECFDGFGYGEVRDPSDYGMISVLAEVDYHDNSDTAVMIINKKKRTAEALARALAKTLHQFKK